MCVCVYVRVCLSVCVEPNIKLCVPLLQDSSKSPRPMKKFLPGNRKKERKPSDDEIQTRKSTSSVLLCGNLLDAGFDCFINSFQLFLWHYYLVGQNSNDLDKGYPFQLVLKISVDFIINQLPLHVKRRKEREQKATAPQAALKTTGDDHKKQATTSWKQWPLLQKRLVIMLQKQFRKKK